MPEHSNGDADGDSGRQRNRKSRFIARSRQESDKSLDSSKVRKTLEDMKGLYAEAQQIVDEGRELFFAPGNLRTRRAATAIIIHLSDAAHRPEAIRIRAQFPDVDWLGLKGQRNWLSHKYDDIDFDAVWYTLSTVFPRERKLLGFD